MYLGDLDALSDVCLVRKFQDAMSEEDRQRFFLEIYRRYRSKVESWAKAICRRDMLGISNIDDVVDRAFFDRLYPEGDRKGLLSFKQECSLECFIRTVTKNCVRDEERKLHPESLDRMTVEHTDDIGIQWDAESYRAWLHASPRPDDTAISEETSKILLSALDRLSHGERRDSWKDAHIVNMYYAHGMTDKEIAAPLGMHEGSVCRRRAMAHKRLRGILERDFGIKNLSDIL